MQIQLLNKELDKVYECKAKRFGNSHVVKYKDKYYLFKYNDFNVKKIIYIEHDIHTIEE